MDLNFMGIYRLILALTVILSHLPSEWRGLTILGNNGGLAVACFFVISGFYMSLIANKYQLHEINLSNYLHFYRSRLFRIYPIYYFVLMLTIIAYSINIIDLEHPISLSMLTSTHLIDKITYVVSNSLIFGQSLIRFFVYNEQKHYFVFMQLIPPTIPNHLLGSSYSILGQSWSLSLELCFYAMMPLLCRLKTQRLLALAILSFSIRFAIMSHNSKSLLGTDIFFPNTIGLFILGMLSHRCIYVRIITLKTGSLMSLVSVTLIASLVLFGTFINLNHNSDNYTTTFWLNWWSFIFLSSLTIPFIFNLSKNNILDRTIGELSYPLYMIHILMIEVIAKNYHGQHPASLVFVTSILSSYLLYIILIKPVNNIRILQRLPYNANTPFIDKPPLTSQ